jgi:maleylacetate reductase
MTSRMFSYSAAGGPTVFSGVDAINSLGVLADAFGWRRALVVTSPSLMRTPVIDAVAAGIGQSRVAGTFSESREHTPIASVEAAYELAQQVDADVLLGVGGGSSMDTAKGIGLAFLSGSSDIREHSGTLSGFKGRLTDPVGQAVELQQTLTRRAAEAVALPLVQIPTTLSAAEATQHAGITGRDGRKEQYHHPLIGARVIVHDPALTLSTPERLWLSTGVKALDHAVEIAYSALGNDLVQGVACNSIRLLRELLPRSVSSAGTLQDRSRLQATAWSVIGLTQATSANVGLDHALVHRLGGRLGIPHGIATCTTLPWVMEYNKPAARDSLALIGRIGFGSTAADADQAADDAIEGVRRLLSDVGLALRLRDYVDDESRLDEIASLTLSDTGMAGNPRQDVTVEDVREILRRAW